MANASGNGGTWTRWAVGLAVTALTLATVTLSTCAIRNESRQTVTETEIKNMKETRLESTQETKETLAAIRADIKELTEKVYEMLAKLKAPPP